MPRVWAVGQRAEVYIQTAQKNGALLVPQQAILWRKGQPGVFLSEAGKAAWREVAIGLRGSETVEITGGLAAGGKVIWPRDAKAAALKEGQTVSVP